MAAANLEFYLSGGGVNTDPDLSLGGQPSSVRLLSQTAVYTGSAISGISIVEAAGNIDGIGSLIFEKNPDRVGWATPYGFTPVFDDMELIDSDGLYYVIDKANKSAILIDVITALLPLINESKQITISSVLNNLFSNVDQSLATTGGEQYRCFYLKNVSGLTLSLEWWIASKMTSDDSIEIGFSTYSSGSIEQLIADETTPPVSVVFYNNTTPEAQQLSVANGDYLGVWLKLITPPLSISKTPIDFGTLIFNEV